jgi:hypothetical protein
VKSQWSSRRRSGGDPINRAVAAGVGFAAQAARAAESTPKSSRCKTGVSRSVSRRLGKHDVSVIECTHGFVAGHVQAVAEQISTWLGTTARGNSHCRMPDAEILAEFERLQIRGVDQRRIRTSLQHAALRSG